MISPLDVEPFVEPVAGKLVHKAMRAGFAISYEAILDGIVQCDLPMSRIHHGEALRNPIAWEIRGVLHIASIQMLALHADEAVVCRAVQSDHGARSQESLRRHEDEARLTPTTAGASHAARPHAHTFLVPPPVIQGHLPVPFYPGCEDLGQPAARKRVDNGSQVPGKFAKRSGACLAGGARPSEPRFRDIWVFLRLVWGYLEDFCRVILVLL